MVEYEIIPKGNRFIIVSPDGKVLDDAQGWGYKTREKAEKAAWWKLKGGKEKGEERCKDAWLFWKDHVDFADEYMDQHMDWFKEICRGEVTSDQIRLELNKKYGLDTTTIQCKSIWDIEDKIIESIREKRKNV